MKDIHECVKHVDGDANWILTKDEYEKHPKIVNDKRSCSFQRLAPNGETISSK
jgi:hypothetical protein